MNKEAFPDSLTVKKTIPESFDVEVGLSKHASNALAGAFALAERVIVPHVPNILDFQRYLDIYESMGSKINRETQHDLEIDNSNLNNHKPDEQNVRDVRASILLLSSALLKTGHIEMPVPEGDWPGSRPTSTTLDIAEKFGAKVVVKNGYIDARLEKPKKMFGQIDVGGKVFATLASMILATGVGGRTIINNPLSSLEVDNLADFLKSMGSKISGLDTPHLIIESDGISKLKKEVVANIAPDACETMYWLAYAKLHNMPLELSFPGWNRNVNSKNWGPLFDMRGLMYYSHMMLGGKGSKATIPQQDIRQLEPVDISAFHDKKGIPRDAAPVLAVLFGALDAISIYHDDKYGARRVDWMTELRKIGGRIDYFSPNKATIWGNEQWGYRAKNDNTVLNGTDIRSAASLLLAASTSDIPVTINGLRHIKRSYTDLPNKMSRLGTEIIYQHS